MAPTPGIGSPENEGSIRCLVAVVKFQQDIIFSLKFYFDNRSTPEDGLEI